MQTLLPYIIGLLATTGYAILPVLAKKANVDVPPFAFISITMIFLSMFSGIASLFFNKDFSLLSMPSSVWIFLIGFAFLNFLAFAFMLASIKSIPIAEYQLMSLLIPIIGASFAYVILQEPFKIQYLIGLIFCSVGLFIALKT